MFVTGPDVIRTVTHEEVTDGGSGRRGDALPRKSGVAHFTYGNDAACLHGRSVELLSYLPSNNMDDPPPAASDDDPERAGRVSRQADSRRSEQALRHQVG